MSPPQRSTATTARSSYCVVAGLDGPDHPEMSPWSGGRREEMADVERRGQAADDLFCMSEVEIFADLSPTEMGVIAAAAPMAEFSAGEMLYSPPEPVERLFILKRGRVRIFRVSADGRALTTAIVTPGMIFGEMLVLGQQMHDNFAEALDDVAVCVMSHDDVRRLLLSDARIAARISEILGNRVAQLERRLSDSVFKSVPQRIASTLCLLAEEQPRRPLARGVQVSLTHEQVAALAGTSRETATKVLGEYADRGWLRLGRGRFTILDLESLAGEAGD
ncbi:Crp/Fnr family transcriptional regulator [Nocardioides sp.]|uniref:Crp/Fnr family transcriptional regulator n=1 Tax=Nocardioides sp. TaxID=35761 RepID=UPI00356A0947